jgi:hypothetical protein
MKNEIILGLLALLVIALPVQGIEIGPGEHYEVNCTGNETVNMTCSDCEPYNETCGACEIQKTLSWNQTYVNTDGNCDLEITCEEMNLSKMGYVNFPMEIQVIKDENNSVEIEIVILDRNDLPLRTWTDIMRSEDIIEQTIRHDFSCPAELTTDINMATCAPYLTRILNSSDPMMLQMVTGQTICTQELVQCMAFNEERMMTANTWENKYDVCDEQRKEMTEDIFELTYNLEDPDGQVAQEIYEIKSEYGGYANAWMAATIILIFLATFGFLIMWWNNNRFEGGA